METQPATNANHNLAIAAIDRMFILTVDLADTFDRELTNFVNGNDTPAWVDCMGDVEESISAIQEQIATAWALAREDQHRASRSTKGST